MLGELHNYEGEEGVVISELTGNQVIIMKDGRMLLRTTDRKFKEIYKPTSEVFPLQLPVESEPDLTEEEKLDLKKRREQVKRVIRETNKKEN